MEKSIVDSIFEQVRTVAIPIIAVRKVVYFECTNGDKGWTLSPNSMGHGRATKSGWIIEVSHPLQQERIVVSGYTDAFLKSNEILRKLGCCREIPIVADDWVIDADGNLDSLSSNCVNVV